MVTRTTPVYAQGHYVYTEYNSDINTTTTVPVNRVFSLGSDTVTHDGAMPFYKQKIATGSNATTNLSGLKRTVTGSPASLRWGRQYHGSGVPSRRDLTISGQLLYTSPPPTIIGATLALPEADDRAVKVFLSRLSETQASFKGAVVAGELRESLMMIKRPLQALRYGMSDYLSHLKKGRRGVPAPKIPSFVRATWLEYSFGWAPLARDIEDGIVAFYKSQWPKPIFKMVRGQGTSGANTVPITAPFIDLGYNCKGLYDTYVEDKAQVRYYGIYHSVGEGPSSFSQAGFNPYEFVPTVWELIPYSFLVDYFLNIGEVISAWSYRNIGCSWVSKGQRLSSTIKTVNTRFQLPPSDSAYSFYGSGDFGSSTGTHSSVLRRDSVSVPLPSLALRVPGLGSVKWLNLVGLTSQLESTRRSLRS